MTEQQQAHPQSGAAQDKTQNQTHDQAQYSQPPYQGPYAAPQYRRLTRTSRDAPISGVCGGLARYFGLDPTLVRVLAVLLAVFTFPAAVIAYIVAWAVIPKE